MTMHELPNVRWLSASVLSEQTTAKLARSYGRSMPWPDRDWHLPKRKCGWVTIYGRSGPRRVWMEW